MICATLQSQQTDSAAPEHLLLEKSHGDASQGLGLEAGFVHARVMDKALARVGLLRAEGSWGADSARDDPSAGVYPWLTRGCLPLRHALPMLCRLGGCQPSSGSPLARQTLQ